MGAEGRPAFWHASLGAEPLKLPQGEQRDVSARGQHPPPASSILSFRPRGQIYHRRAGAGSPFPAAGRHSWQLPPGDQSSEPQSACGEGRRAQGTPPAPPEHPLAPGLPVPLCSLSPAPGWDHLHSFMSLSLFWYHCHEPPCRSLWPGGKSSPERRGTAPEPMSSSNRAGALHLPLSLLNSRWRKIPER